jgi:hypothetical protein
VAPGRAPLVARAGQSDVSKESELAMSELLDYRWVLAGVAALFIAAWTYFLYHDAREMLLEMDRQNDR